MNSVCNGGRYVVELSVLERTKGSLYRLLRHALFETPNRMKPFVLLFKLNCSCHSPLSTSDPAVNKQW